MSLPDFLEKYHDSIVQAFANFQGLPHRLQFLRELNGVKYYDDNFCTNVSSLQVALQAFPKQNIVLITGGRDKTNNQDLPEIVDLLRNHTAKTILIGESGHDIARILTNTQASDDDLTDLLAKTTHNQFFLASDLTQATNLAQNLANQLHIANNQPTVVLMSPAAASFDMFENVYDRGAQFQQLVQELA